MIYRIRNLLHIVISKPMHQFRETQSHLHIQQFTHTAPLLYVGFTYKLPSVAKGEPNSTRLFQTFRKKSKIRPPRAAECQYFTCQETMVIECVCIRISYVQFLGGKKKERNEIALLKIFSEGSGDLQLTLGRVFFLVHVGHAQPKLQPRSLLFLFKHIFSLFT